MTCIHTLTDDDIGHSHVIKTCECCGYRRTISLHGAIGYVQPVDVGKRVYLVRDEANVSDVVQIESNAQRDRRLT
jgi:hypothetical protein